MGNTAILFRLVAASFLVGLGAFCLAHVVQVWRKRNAKPGAGGSASRRLAWVALISGLLLTPIAVVARSLSRTDGVLTGEGLFVVRARANQTVLALAEPGEVAAGAPLVRFGVDPREDKAEELAARVARAQAEYDQVALVPPTAAPELVRRQQDLLHERVLAQQELGQVILAAEAAGRDLTLQSFTKTETLARLDRTLTEKRKDLDRALARRALARDLLALYQRLSAKEMVATAEFKRVQTDARETEVEVEALRKEIKQLDGEQALVKSQVAAIEAERSDRTGLIGKLKSDLADRLAKLSEAESDVRGRIAADLARSGKMRDIERAQAAARVREVKAAAEAFARETLVTAPFAGRVAYRAASPNANFPGGALAVLAPEKGFLLTARMEQADADNLREGRDATIEVSGEDGPERVIPARFHHAAALDHEPGHAVLRLECQPPPGLVRRLADGDRVSVVFVWYPPLAGLWSVRVGVLLAVGGAVGVALTHAAALRRLWAVPESAPAVAAVPGPSEPLVELVPAYPPEPAPEPLEAAEPVPLTAIIDALPLIEPPASFVAAPRTDPTADDDATVPLVLPADGDESWFDVDFADDPVRGPRSMVLGRPTPEPPKPVEPPKPQFLPPTATTTPTPMLTWRGLTRTPASASPDGIPASVAAPPPVAPPPAPPTPPPAHKDATPFPFARLAHADQVPGRADISGPPTLRLTVPVPVRPPTPTPDAPPATLAEAEAAHRDTLAEVNLARTPEEAAEQLAKLNRLRWVLRQMQPLPDAAPAGGHRP